MYLGLWLAMLAPQRASGDQFTEYLNGRGIYAIVYDDKRSVLWFGTANDGLIKFDGANFTAYKFPTPPNSSTFYSITALALDGDHNLWVGTSSLGAGLFHIDENAWQVYNTTNGLTDNSVSGIAIDSNGRIWFGTKVGAGLFNRQDWYRYTTDKYEKWDAAKTQWEPTNVCPPNREYLSDNEILAVAVDAANQVWFGGRKGVSTRFKECEWDTLDTQNIRVLSILIDRQQRKWFGTTNGLYKLESDRGKPQRQRPEVLNGNVYAGFVDYEGILWFGTQTGAARFDPFSQIWRFTTGAPDFDTNPITTIAADEDGAHWFGAYVSPPRVVKYTANWFSYSSDNDDSLKALRSNRIAAMARDRLGQIWIGTLNGIGRYDSAGWKAREYFPNDPRNTINAIAVATDNTLWLGTSAGRAIQVRPNSDIKRTFFIDRREIDAIALDGDFIWFGTERGVRRLKLSDSTWQDFTRTTPTGGPIGDFVYALAVDWRGRLWCGTEAGASCYDGGRWRSFTIANGLPANEINAITIDRDNDLVWFATPGGAANVAIVDTIFKFNTITVANGLVDNFVHDIEVFTTPGQKGYQEIWFATASGVSCRNAVGEWVTYTERDGLADNNVSVIQPGRKANEIWFGTNDEGVTRYRRHEKKPNTEIANPIDVVTQPVVIYEFAGNDLNTTKGLLRYSFQLDNDPWSEYTPSTIARIPVIQNGPHVFRVKAIDRDKNEDPSPACDFFYKIDPRTGDCTILNDTTCFTGDSVKIELCWPPGQLADTARVTILPVPRDLLKNTAALFAYDLLPPTLLINRKGVTLSFEFPPVAGVSGLGQEYLVYRAGEGAQAQSQQQISPLGGTNKVENGRVKITTQIRELGRYAVRLRGAQPEAGFAFAEARVNAQPRIFSPRGGGYGPRTNVSFTLPKPAAVNIKVYNLAGRLVKTLYEAPMNEGVNAVSWNGRDYNGNICTNGLYIVMIKSDALPKTVTVKVMVVNE